MWENHPWTFSRCPFEGPSPASRSGIQPLARLPPFHSVLHRRCATLSHETMPPKFSQISAKVREYLERKRAPPKEIQEDDGYQSLADILKELWAFGELSSYNVQRIAQAAQISSGTRDLTALAALGKHGTNRNVPRDLQALVASDVVPAPYAFEVPALSSKAKKQVSARCAVLLPHQVFAFVAEHHPALFDSWSPDLSRFWSAAIAAGDPHLHNHPLVRRRPQSWRTRAIPITIYGDACRYSQRESMELACWSPLLLRKSSTWSSHFIAASWVKTAQDGKATWNEIWKVLTWSLQSLLEGTHPQHDYRGRPVAADSREATLSGRPLSSAGYFAVVHRICKDLAWYQQTLGVQKFAPQANECCPFCLANRSTRPFKDFSQQSPWRETVLTLHSPPHRNTRFLACLASDFTLCPSTSCTSWIWGYCTTS